MKNRIFAFLLPFLIFLLMPAITFAQYEKVDGTVKLYPKSFSDPQQLALKINSDFSEPDEKARAIFTWISLNIKYDLKAYYTQANKGIAYSFFSPEDKIKKDARARTCSSTDDGVGSMWKRTEPAYR